jgi:hypothetical protein
MQRDGRRVEDERVLRVGLGEDGALHGTPEAVARARSLWIEPGFANMRFLDASRGGAAIEAGDGVFEALRCGDSAGPPTAGTCRIWTAPGLGLPGDVLRGETREGGRSADYRVSRYETAREALMTATSGSARTEIRAELDLSLPGRVRRLVETREGDGAWSELRLETLD